MGVVDGCMFLFSHLFQPPFTFWNSSCNGCVIFFNGFGSEVVKLCKARLHTRVSSVCLAPSSSDRTVR